MESFKVKIINIIWNANPKEKNIKRKLIKNGLNININLTESEFGVRGYEIVDIKFHDPIAVAHEISKYFDLIKFDTWTVSNIDEIEEDQNELAQKLFRKISELINSKIMIRNTVINQTINFIKNLFINAPITTTSINLVDFHGKFPNRPFLIVAAGPSLDKQLPVLQKYQEYFYIIAVDKAYPSLSKYDITPDFVITIDPKSTPSWSQNGLNQKTIFINDIGSNPAITWSNNKNHLFISCTQEVLKIGGFFGIQADMLETGGSVATSAFSFSYMAGANPIILIGQDLAFTNNKDHAEDYINPFGDKLIASKINSGYTTKGYYGEDVSTDKQFLMYKSWYEKKFVQINDRLIFNCTEGGAHLEGATNVPFLALCESLEEAGMPKIPLINEPIFTGINPKLIDKISDNIDISIWALGEIKLKFEIIENDISNRKIFNNFIELKIQENLTLIEGLDENLKLLISKFNQLKLYNLNRSTIREEKKTGKDLLMKYKEFFRETSHSIHLTIDFLNGILKIYRRMKNRVEIDSDSINQLKSDT
jgi:hypothetical protein